MAGTRRQTDDHEAGTELLSLAQSGAGARGARTGLALACQPYHRGGSTSWMGALGVEWQRSWGECWLITPRPRRPFVNGSARPTMAEMIEAGYAERRPHLVTPDVGDDYEFGTCRYRASVYAAAVLRAVPAGVPLIVSDDPSAWRAGAWLAARHPLVLVVHGNWDGYDRLVRRYGACAAAIVGVSRRVQLRTESLPGRGSAPVVTIPLGMPLPPVLEAPADPHRELRLAWAGRMDEQFKRVSDLPKIAARLAESGVDFSMDVMGDGDAADDLRRDFARAGVADRVRMHAWGSRDEVRRLFAASDVCLLPSNEEGHPVTMIEALGAGCAVVASRVSGVEDYEHHPLASGALWVHPTGHVKEAARLAVEAGREPREARRARARAFAEAEFSIAACARRYAELLPRLAVPPAAAGYAGIRNRRVISLLSRPVAAQRVARLWLTGQFRRPANQPPAAP